MNKGRQKDKTGMPFLSSCVGVLLVLCWRNMLPYLQPLVSVQKCCFGLIRTYLCSLVPNTFVAPDAFTELPYRPRGYACRRDCRYI